MQTSKPTPTFFHRDTVQLTPLAQKRKEYAYWLKDGADTVGYVLCEDRDGTVLVDFAGKVQKRLTVYAYGICLDSSPDNGVIWVSRHDLKKVEV